MSFTSDNRTGPLWATVSYHDVPMFRALALALDHAQEDGAQFAIWSADRRDDVLTVFNTQNGTNLHGQQFLFDHQKDPGFFPANRPDTSSHCLFADGNPAYRVGAKLIPVGGALPKFFLGIDASDLGPGAKPNDCSILIGHLERLGYHVTRPYHSGAEAHHFVFSSDPTPVLRHWDRIPPAKGKGVVPVTPPVANPTVLSPEGAAFIARFEGFRAKLYNDPATPPNATIGFGHLVHAGPIDGSEPAELKQGITKQQALALLQTDCAGAAAAVSSCVKVPLNQQQFDALVSFTFNLGAGNLQQSTLLKKLNAGDYDAVPSELARWVHAGKNVLPGLVTRRAAEGTLFATGAYPAEPVTPAVVTPPVANPTVLSPEGAAFIARFEGFRAKLYNDPATPPNATIGFGHLVHAGPIDGSEPAELKQGITKQQALALLQTDCAGAAAAVSSCVKVPLNQQQFDALVSFTFNLGAGNLQQSTLLKKLNAGDYDAVPSELARWVHAGKNVLPGLVTRRAAEGTLFATGAYQ